MTRADLIAELRGIETKGSEHWCDPEVWGAILGAAMSVKHHQEELRRSVAKAIADPSDNSFDDGG